MGKDVISERHILHPRPIFATFSASIVLLLKLNSTFSFILLGLIRTDPVVLIGKDCWYSFSLGLNSASAQGKDFLQSIILVFEAYGNK